MILDQMQRPACMHWCFFDTKRRTFLLSYLCSQLTHESAKRQTLLTQNKHFQTLKEDVNYLSKFKIKTKNVNFENKFSFLWTANSCGRDFATGRRIPGNFIHLFLFVMHWKKIKQIRLNKNRSTKYSNSLN